MAKTCGPSKDPASRAFYDPLDDSQTETDPVTIHLRSPVQLTKPGEKFWQVFCTDSYSSVDHMHHEALLLQVVASHDFDLSLSGKLFCILHEVDQDLLQSSFIAKEKWWQTRPST